MKNGKLLDLYSDYLISAFGQTTATGLSSLLDGEISQIAKTKINQEKAFEYIRRLFCYFVITLTELCLFLRVNTMATRATTYIM